MPSTCTIVCLFVFSNILSKSQGTLKGFCDLQKSTRWMKIVHNKVKMTWMARMEMIMFSGNLKMQL